MARWTLIGAAIGAAGLIAGCVYDPAAQAYEPCCASPAYAEPAPPGAPPPQQYAQSDQPPVQGAAPAPNAGAQKFIEKFHRANVTNDGKLTLEQARAAGMHVIVSHFDQIDTAHKGYVTLDDIRAARAAHQQRAGKPPPPPPSAD